MIKEITQIDYQFEIDLKRVMDEDTIIDMDEDREDSEMLYNKLMNVIGVLQVDYNGHFGNYIFLKVNPEFDNEEMWKEIENITMNHIKIDHQRCPECNCLLERHRYDPEYTAKCIVCKKTVHIKKGWMHHV